MREITFLPAAARARRAECKPSPRRRYIGKSLNLLFAQKRKFAKRLK